MSPKSARDRRAVERGVRVQRRGPHAAPSPPRPSGPGPATRAGLVYAGGRDRVGERGEGALGVADDAGGAEPLGVVAVDVDRREPHVGVLEQRLRRGGEVGQPGPDGEHEVGLRGPGRCWPGCPPARCRRSATTPAAGRRPCRRRSPATGMPAGVGERLELGGGVGVDDAAAGDDDRLLGARRGARRRPRPRPGRRSGGGSPSRARRRTRPGSRRRATARPAAATARRRRCRPGRSAPASRAGSAVSSCSGRVIRSKNRRDRPEGVVHGRRRPRPGAAAAAAPGPGGGWRRCRRAAAAPAAGSPWPARRAVTRFSAPGPIDAVTARVARRRIALA